MAPTTHRNVHTDASDAQQREARIRNATSVPIVQSDSEQPNDESERTNSELSMDVQERNGFLLRGGLGFGYLHYPSGNDEVSNTITGFQLSTMAHVGALLSHSFALHGTLIYNTSLSASVDGESIRGSTSIFGIGPGGTLYLSESNWYLSGSLLLYGLGFSESEEGMKFGPGTSIVLGKEWAAGKDVGLGAAFKIDAGYVSLGNGTSSTPLNFGLLFTASYN